MVVSTQCFVVRKNKCLTCSRSVPRTLLIRSVALFLPNELIGALDINRAPNAAAPPRREPNLITDFVNALPNSVDPTEAERLIHRLWPCDARLSRILFIKSIPKFRRRRMIFLKPLPQLRWRSKECDLKLQRMSPVRLPFSLLMPMREHRRLCSVQHLKCSHKCEWRC